MCHALHQAQRLQVQKTHCVLLRSSRSNRGEEREDSNYSTVQQGALLGTWIRATEITLGVREGFLTKETLEMNLKECNVFG